MTPTENGSVRRSNKEGATRVATPRATVTTVPYKFRQLLHPYRARSSSSPLWSRSIQRALALFLSFNGAQRLFAFVLLHLENNAWVRQRLD